MKASVGCRILRATRDAFAVCAIGEGDRSNELFWYFVVQPWQITKRTSGPTLDAPLIYVLKKAGAFAVSAVQIGLMGFWTVADKIAYLPEKDISTATSVGTWVYHLMRKLMQALGMKIVKDVNELTRALMHTLLVRILIRMREYVQTAVRKI